MPGQRKRAPFWAGGAAPGMRVVTLQRRVSGGWGIEGGGRLRIDDGGFGGAEGDGAAPGVGALGEAGEGGGGEGEGGEEEGEGCGGVHGGWLWWLERVWGWKEWIGLLGWGSGSKSQGSLSYRRAGRRRMGVRW